MISALQAVTNYLDDYATIEDYCLIKENCLNKAIFQDAQNCYQSKYKEQYFWKLYKDRTEK